MHPVPRRPSETPPPRIKPLSVLPVFLDLAGKRAVVAGGSEAAAWKAELLAAAGADVHVYARPDDVSEELTNIVAREPGVTLHARAWDGNCLRDAAVALADAENEEQAAAFEAAARQSGTICNVIDNPAYCHFQFGSIVNRSPVVVGISTSGAAPILGQAVRRRIETLLPASLAEWAALARTLRDIVAERLMSGASRRAFWEGLVDRAFGPAPHVGAAEELARGIRTTTDEIGRGHVTFVGAGPGDAELLTLKAVRTLQAADVILFDDLVSDEVLELARREARRILVGKRSGRASCQQHEINDWMVKLARAGRRVVRLKSGDPMIFGRAGEEIAALDAAGIPFDIVPGITAGLAMAAAFGVSLTHRDHAKSVRFVTGHSKAGGLPEDVDWLAIADPSATTVFYMAGQTAGDIAERLIETGLSPHTPVVVAAAIGRAAEQLRTTDLAGLAQTIASLDATLPILIGFGEAFREAENVDPVVPLRTSAASR